MRRPPCQLPVLDANDLCIAQAGVTPCWLGRTIGWCYVAVLVFCFANFAHWADASDGQLEFFEKKIRPVLVEHCYQCHAADAKKIRGGLLLDTREAIRRGGESGPGVVPTEPSESLVLDALRHETFEMPPSGKLSDQVVADFERWIRDGAIDPREGNSPAIESAGIDIEKGRQFWSFRPLSDSALPSVESTAWPETDIDLFLLSQLESKHLRPVPDADRPTLIRRAHLALTGLPPTPEQIQAFVKDPMPTNELFAQLVDRLLESKHFGERWGRHWLDVVRFAESSGGGRTLLFPDAWRYRDYVIDAFNEDRPYDQFLREQIAGDLLPFDNWETQRRQLTATTFLLLGPTNYELQDKDVLEMDIVDEQIDTIGKAFMGMTIGCARCHDHKFDPIPMNDYYAMAGILKNTKSVIHSNVSAWNKMKLPVQPEREAELAAHEAELATLEKTLRDEKAVLAKLKKVEKKKAGDAKPKSKSKTSLDEQVQDLLAGSVKDLENRVKELKKRGPERPFVMAPVDEDKTADIHLAIRGVAANKGPVVPRGVLQVALRREFPKVSDTESGRLPLADWIVDPTNPLTARVMVNRVWYWLFGEGLVRTVDNFGAMGEAPSHPELLDYLAQGLIQDDWSIKRLVRRIMLSHTYRLSSSDRHAEAQDALAIDSSNRLLWKMNRRRLDAETIRDSIMSVAGTLDLRMGGSNIKPKTKIEYDYVFDSQRRSVYLPVFRNTLPQIFSTFDFADPNIQGGKRTTSTIAPQALLLMNQPFVIHQTKAAAESLLQSDTELGERIEYCYAQVLGREPTSRERALAEEFIVGNSGLGNGNSQQRWSLLYQTLFQSLDFRYVK